MSEINKLFEESINVKQEILNSNILNVIERMDDEISHSIKSVGKALEFCDEAFLVPSSDTGRIQESHITAGHALMEYIEDQLLQDGFLELNKTLNK